MMDAPLGQVRHRVLGEQEGAPDVHRERLVEGVLRVVGDRAGRPRDPGVGDHHVEPAELPDRGRHGRLDLPRVGDIGHLPCGLGAELGRARPHRGSESRPAKHSRPRPRGARGGHPDGALATGEWRPCPQIRLMLPAPPGTIAWIWVADGLAPHSSHRLLCVAAGWPVFSPCCGLGAPRSGRQLRFRAPALGERCLAACGYVLALGVSLAVKHARAVGTRRSGSPVVGGTAGPAELDGRQGHRAARGLRGRPAGGDVHRPGHARTRPRPRWWPPRTRTPTTPTCR